MLRVLNKVDQLTPQQVQEIPRKHGVRQDEGPALVSALTGDGIEELLRRIDVALPTDPLVALCCGCRSHKDVLWL